MPIPIEHVQLLEQVNAEGFLSNFGIRFRRCDGSHYFASLSLSRLEMAGQEVLLGITDDVTEQVEAQQALATLNQMSYDMASISDLQAPDRSCCTASASDRRLPAGCPDVSRRW